MFHLKVIFNGRIGELTYDRKLTEGNGHTIYGLEGFQAMDITVIFCFYLRKVGKQIWECLMILLILRNGITLVNSM